MNYPSEVIVHDACKGFQANARLNERHRFFKRANAESLRRLKTRDEIWVKMGEDWAMYFARAYVERKGHHLKIEASRGGDTAIFTLDLNNPSSDYLSRLYSLARRKAFELEVAKLRPKGSFIM